MAELYFESSEDAYTGADLEDGRRRRAPVSEQHPLPIQIAWRPEGYDQWVIVDEAHPLPVNSQGITLISTKLKTIHQPIPGIGTGSAYTSGDAFGTRFVMDVPIEGTIAFVTFRDYDDEGLNKEIVLFSQEFTETADNAAFAPSDGDLRVCVGVIPISGWYNFGSNQIGHATPAMYYVAPYGKLWGQIVTRGADNIAAGAIPDFTMVIT